MKAAEYLKAVKLKRNITSDYALAKALKVSKQTAAKYISGVAIPGPVVAFRVAEILGEQPAGLIAEFENERAERDGRAEEAEEMQGWIKKIGGGAAGVLLALGLSVFPNGNNALASTLHIDGAIHRMKLKRD